MPWPTPIGTAFAQDDAEAARKQWRQVADGARPRVFKLAALMDDARPMSWPVWSSPRSTAPKSTNPLERLKGEIKRPSEMVGISPTKPPGGSSDAYLSVFAGDSSVRAFAAAMNMLALAS